MSNALCTATHICQGCKRECSCGTYTWACPWINDDEIQMCDPCLDKLADEMYEFERLQEGNHIE